MGFTRWARAELRKPKSDALFNFLKSPCSIYLTALVLEVTRGALRLGPLSPKPETLDPQPQASRPTRQPPCQFPGDVLFVFLGSIRDPLYRRFLHGFNGQPRLVCTLHVYITLRVSLEFQAQFPPFATQDASTIFSDQIASKSLWSQPFPLLRAQGLV